MVQTLTEEDPASGRVTNNMPIAIRLIIALGIITACFYVIWPKPTDPKIQAKNNNHLRRALSAVQKAERAPRRSGRDIHLSKAFSEMEKHAKL
jgi:hypothetical protein